MANPLLEFLIRRTDPEGSWFDVNIHDIAAVFTPKSVASEPVRDIGELGLRILGVEVSINFEDPGFHVTLNGSIDERKARALVDEMVLGLCRHTGQRARVVEL